MNTTTTRPATGRPSHRLEDVSENEPASQDGTETVPPPLADRIRHALREIPESKPGNSKENVRDMHMAARQHHIAEAADWIQDAWRKRQHLFVNGADLDPAQIKPKLVPVTNTETTDLFRLARYTWSLPYSKGYGRRLRFLVVDTGHGNTLMGVIGLQSPPIDFPLRDKKAAFPEGRKVELVNQTMDIYTLGSVPPYNDLLAGKLMIYATTSREISEAYQTKYVNTKTEIKGDVLPAELVLLTTTSAFGRSSMYNRVSYPGRSIAEKLGYTTGYGSIRLNSFKDIYPDIKKFLRDEGYGDRMGFGKGGPKEVWRNITQVIQMLGINDNGLKHGINREAWAISLASNAWEYLGGADPEPYYHQEKFAELTDWWKTRWLLPRAERKTDWRHWQKDLLLQSITPEAEPYK